MKMNKNHENNEKEGFEKKVYIILVILLVF